MFCYSIWENKYVALQSSGQFLFLISDVVTSEGPVSTAAPLMTESPAATIEISTNTLNVDDTEHITVSPSAGSYRPSFTTCLSLMSVTVAMFLLF